MKQPLMIGTAALGIADVVAVARRGHAVALDADARQAVAAARAVVERFEQEDLPVYGLTRGLGGQVVKEVKADERDGYSRVVVLARACGAGDPFATEVVRAALLARAAGMARAGAGVRPLLIDRLIEMLNCGVSPLVPSIGSVGASDLALMANLALPLLGEGRAVFDGERMAGAEAMRRAGLEPLELHSKEGLALCSANSISTGFGALVLADTRDLIEILDAVAVLSFEAFRANLSPIDARVAAARPAPGQAESAASLRRKLAGTRLFEAGAARRVQDPISLRCVSQVHGSLRAAAAFVEPNLEAELNGAGDNPLILTDDPVVTGAPILTGGGDILSNGNFHTPAMAVAFDTLALALSQTARLSAERVSRLMAREFTDLPDRLSDHGTTRIGVGMLSLTAATLVKEIHLFAHPVSLDDSSGYAVEDHAPMTPLAVRKAERILGLLRQIVACELIVASQAFDIRAPDQAAPLAQGLRDALRAVVPRLDDDRSQSQDLERATALVADGRLLDIVSSA